MKLKEQLDKFAADLIAKASKENTPLVESTDAFKAVVAYYSAQQKKRNNTDDEPASDGFTFTDEVIHGGSKAVPTRRSS